MEEAYRADLAHIHDQGFTAFARKAGDGVLQIFSQRGIDKGLVVDLGCGSGVWARTLVDAGYQVHGIDISKEMIDLCRQRVPESTFEVGSFLETSLPSCQAVTSMGECLNYLFDKKNNLHSLSRLFQQIYNALESGGLFIFDVITPGYAKASGPKKRHVKTENWAVLVEIEENAANHTLKRSITTFNKIGEHYRRDEEVHHVQLYQGDALRDTLQDTGFDVTLTKGYPGYDLTPTHAVLIAQKV